MRTRALRSAGLAAGTWMLVAVLAGCDGSGGGLGRQTGFSSRAIPGATRAQVYQAALEEARRRFQVRQTDAASDTIECQPQYVGDSAGSSGQLRILSTPSDRRRVARVRVSGTGGVVRAEAGVALQRRDTAQIQQYQAMRSATDVPIETPVDRGEDLGPERREVWTTYGRDLEMEDELLTAIERRFAPTTQPER